MMLTHTYYGKTYQFRGHIPAPVLQMAQRMLTPLFIILMAALIPFFSTESYPVKDIGMRLNTNPVTFWSWKLKPCNICLVPRNCNDRRISYGSTGFNFC